MKTTLLNPKDYARSPWKNGGGVFTDIADAYQPGRPKDWDSLIWRFGRTPIVQPGPFSHLPGIDRLQMVVKGRGLVLKAPEQQFDEREPFKTVRFTGELDITTRLEDGAVEVVNLMARRDAAEIELVALREPGDRRIFAGTHLLYAARGDCLVRLEGAEIAIADDCTLRVELTDKAKLTLVSGLAVLGSVQVAL